MENMSEICITGKLTHAGKYGLRCRCYEIQAARVLGSHVSFVRAMFAKQVD